MNCWVFTIFDFDLLTLVTLNNLQTRTKNGMLSRFVLLALLGACVVLSVFGDQFVYVDTDAEDIVNENLSQTPAPDAHLKVRTSNSYHAGSTDTILVTFVGSFSVSGPHTIGPFNTGAKDTVIVSMDRVIGQLEKVIMHKVGVDSYLLSELECRIYNQVYVMNAPRRWLDNFDVATEAQYPESGAYEPLAHESTEDLPAATALTLEVDRVFYYYTETGMLTN